eukprot:1161995-Pelagomonas_calceolata.AAC.7
MTNTQALLSSPQPDDPQDAVVAKQYIMKRKTKNVSWLFCIDFLLELMLFLYVAGSWASTALYHCRPFITRVPFCLIEAGDTGNKLTGCGLPLVLLDHSKYQHFFLLSWTVRHRNQLPGFPLVLLDHTRDQQASQQTRPQASKTLNR